MDSNETPRFGAENIFKLPFTIKSIQWGISLGTLLACHKYQRVRSGVDAIFFGSSWGLVVSGVYWFYNMYQFTIAQHSVKAQSLHRHQVIQTTKFVPHYIRDKYQVHELSDEQIQKAVDYIDSKWEIIQDELNK